MDTGPIIILANDQKCCYYQSSIQYIARIITTILHHNRDTTLSALSLRSLFFLVRRLKFRSMRAINAECTPSKSYVSLDDL